MPFSWKEKESVVTKTHLPLSNSQVRRLERSMTHRHPKEMKPGGEGPGQKYGGPTQQGGLNVSQTPVTRFLSQEYTNMRPRSRFLERIPMQFVLQKASSGKTQWIMSLQNLKK